MLLETRKNGGIVEMKKLLQKVRKHGLIGAIAILKNKILMHYYRLKCKLLKPPIWEDMGGKEFKLIEKELSSSGISIQDLYVNKGEFEDFKTKFVFGKDFYGGAKSALFNEKVLEHFIAYKLCVQQMSDKQDIYIDVAAANSPWTKLLRERGYNTYAIDLQPSDFRNLDYYLVMDATKTTFADNSISFVSLQCAYEMFIKDSDIKLISELSRILKIAGRAVICPLYLYTHYSGFSSPEFFFRKNYHDKEAKVYLAPNNMRGIPFARFYDVRKLKERVLETIAGNGLSYNLYILRNGKEIDQNIYCHFVLEIAKK